MVAEAVGLGRKRRTQPQTRRSRCRGGHPEANCETEGVAKSLNWGAEGKAKAEGRIAEQRVEVHEDSPQQPDSSARGCAFWDVQPQWGWQRDNLSRAGAWEAARGYEYLELTSCGVDGREEEGGERWEKVRETRRFCLGRLLLRCSLGSVWTSSRLGGRGLFEEPVGGAVAMICRYGRATTRSQNEGQEGEKRGRSKRRSSMQRLDETAASKVTDEPTLWGNRKQSQEDTSGDGGSAVAVRSSFGRSKGKGEGGSRRLLPLAGTPRQCWPPSLSPRTRQVEAVQLPSGQSGSPPFRTGGRVPGHLPLAVLFQPASGRCFLFGLVHLLDPKRRGGFPARCSPTSDICRRSFFL
jgi:hypothetical protein